MYKYIPTDTWDIGFSNSMAQPMKLRCCVLTFFLINHWNDTILLDLLALTLKQYFLLMVYHTTIVSLLICGCKLVKDLEIFFHISTNK